jgi:hypothetical protein
MFQLWRATRPGRNAAAGKWHWWLLVSHATFDSSKFSIFTGKSRTRTPVA